jgi:hypothetical protein
MMRRQFGSKMKKGGLGKLHTVELHNLCSSTIIIRIIKSRRMRRARFVSLIMEETNAYMILVIKPGGKRRPGRPKHRRECV